MSYSDRLHHTASLDEASVRRAYRRWAAFYDTSFGWYTRRSRRITVDLVNALPGREVLEVGVGTGLALPRYHADKRITGIDLSAEMLALAQARVARLRLSNIAGLHEMDATATGWPDGAFDIAVAMYVASVTPAPRALLAELRRVVRPGGHILFINHFAATGGARLQAEKALAPAARALGWHPDFPLQALLDPAEQRSARLRAMPPFGLFTLVRLTN